MSAVLLAEGLERMRHELARPMFDPLAVVTAGAKRPRALVEYQTRPIAFAVEVLHIPEWTLRWTVEEAYGAHQWDGTRDPLLAIFEGLVAGEDVCVESGTGTGKSFLLAVIILWFVACWDGARVFTFAPKEEQLRLYAWSEVRKLWHGFAEHFPEARLTDLRIRMLEGSDEWGAVGFAVGIKAGEQSATKAQGQHAPHMLHIYEETPGIPLAVLEAGENTATGDHNLRLAVGNPDHQLDALHLFAFDEIGRRRPGVRHVRISALDHPNVVVGKELIPGAVTRKSVERRRAKYGTDGRMFESRVRGVSPKQAVDALIKLEWIEAAVAAWEEEMKKPESERLYTLSKRGLGVDVANSEAGDEAAIAEGWGHALLKVEEFPCPDANVLGWTVQRRAKEKQILGDHIAIDTVGVGVGSYNECVRLELYPFGFNGGASAESTPDSEGGESFDNLRSAGYWQLREDFRRGRIMMMRDPELIAELITPKWGTTARVVWVEAKEDIKARTPGGKSPNKADAVMYWNWVRDREPVLQSPPSRAPTIRERLMAEFEALDRSADEQRAPAYRTLRQG